MVNMVTSKWLHFLITFQDNQDDFGLQGAHGRVAQGGPAKGESGLQVTEDGSFESCALFDLWFAP